MFRILKKKKIYPAYVSKHNSNRGKQVIFLTISDVAKLRGAKSLVRSHYLVVKKLSALLRGITSKDQGDLYCLNCFYSFTTENKLNRIKQYFKIKIFAVLECLLKTLNY